MAFPFSLSLVAPLVALCLSLVGIAGAYWKGRTDGKDIIRAEWSAKLVQAQEQARQRERELQDKADEVARNAEKRNRILAERVATADSAVERLLHDIDAANRAAKAPECAADAHAASAARELLGTCAARYTAVAGEADRLAGQVTGLQDYANSIR